MATIYSLRVDSQPLSRRLPITTDGEKRIERKEDHPTKQRTGIEYSIRRPDNPYPILYLQLYLCLCLYLYLVCLFDIQFSRTCELVDYCNTESSEVGDYRGMWAMKYFLKRYASILMLSYDHSIVLLLLLSSSLSLRLVSFPILIVPLI